MMVRVEVNIADVNDSTFRTLHTDQYAGISKSYSDSDGILKLQLTTSASTLLSKLSDESGEIAGGGFEPPICGI